MASWRRQFLVCLTSLKIRNILYNALLYCKKRDLLKSVICLDFKTIIYHLLKKSSTPVKRKGMRFMSKGVLKERTNSRYILLCSKTFCARLCSLWPQSPICLCSLWPWDSFDRNQGSMKEEAKWHISGSPSNRSLGTGRYMIPDFLAVKHHRSSVAGKTVMYLQWFRAGNPNPQKHCISLNGANVLYQL